MKSEYPFTHEDAGRVFSWAEVNTVHRVRIGIYQSRGRLISLLTDFGRINPCYPDHHAGNENTIIYTGNGRRGDQKLDAQNRALLDAIETAHEVPLFNKLGINRWQFLGFWRVADGKYVYDDERCRMIWRFTLCREGVAPLPDV
jgi:hypothetical protein